MFDANALGPVFETGSQLAGEVAVRLLTQEAQGVGALEVVYRLLPQCGLYLLGEGVLVIRCPQARTSSWTPSPSSSVPMIAIDPGSGPPALPVQQRLRRMLRAGHGGTTWHWYHGAVSTHRTSILFLSSDPADASRLRLGQELRDIQMRLRLANAGDAFELHHRTSVRPGDLTQAIFDTKPTIIHFSGHGSPAGELLLENDAGQVHPVTPEALESLFSLCKDDVRCVILNACYSQSQAAAISKHIDHVIGMTQAISDDAAIAFSVGFYKALGAGRSLKDCFEFGRTELRLLNIPQYQIPILRQRPKVKHMYLREEEYLVRGEGYSEKTFAPEHGLMAKFMIDSDAMRGCVLLDPEAYDSVGHILDDIYINYLRELVPMFSYGVAWLMSIGCDFVRRPLVPWHWISKHDNTRYDDMLSWSRTLVPGAVGLNRGCHGNILLSKKELLPENYLLVASNNYIINDVIQSDDIKAICALVKSLDGVPVQEFDGNSYRYKAMISRGFRLKHGVFVDPGLAESDLARFKR